MSTSTEDFSEHYRTLADGELLALARHRQQLAAAASVALDAELAARSLREEALHEFKDQMRAKVEPEPEDAQDELPPPSELPDDWFDDDADSSTGSPASSRPKGVTVVAFVFWLSGSISAAWGAWTIFGRAAGASSQLLVTAALAMVLGILQFVAGFGLWRLNSWARKLGEALCWVNVILATVSIAVAAFIRLRGFAVDPVIAIGEFLGFLWQVSWALYLGSRAPAKSSSRHRNKLGTRERRRLRYFRRLPART